MLFLNYLHKNKPKKKHIKGSVFFLVTFFLFMSLTSSSIKAEPFKCEVTIILDQHEVEYIVGPNCSFELVVHGFVSCDFEGAGENFQYIELYLWTGSSESWSVGVGPTFMIFSTSGMRSINVTINIPPNVYNQTENLVTVAGHWEANYGKNSVLGSSGDPIPDHLNIKINRTVPITFPKTTSPEYDEPTDFLESFGLQYTITIISLPISIIILIIIIIYYRRKKWKKLLSE